MSISSKNIDDSYLVGKALGRGTFGDVYSAQSKQSNQAVALKVLRDTGTSSHSYESLREVIFFQNVAPHHNLIELHELFKDVETNNVVFALEYMRGNLFQFMESHRRKASDRCIDGMVVAKIMRDVLKGVEHIHECGFAHRDLKPENILWNGDNRHIVVKLADFGLSRQISAGSSRPWTGYVATRWYRSPEQLLDLKAHTTAVDIWAVSLILYEICNLAPLFPGKTTQEMVERQVEALGIPSNGAIGGSSPEVLSELEQLYGRSLTKEARKLNGYVVTLDWLRWEPHEVFAELLISGLQWDPQQRPNAGKMLQILRHATYDFRRLWSVNKKSPSNVVNRSKSI